MVDDGRDYLGSVVYFQFDESSPDMFVCGLTLPWDDSYDAFGYFGIWPLWVGGVVLLFLNRYYAALDFLILALLMASLVQIVGLVVLYVGSLFFAWAIGSAGRYLRPSTSGVYASHGLVQDGPLGVVRHPYYVSGDAHVSRHMDFETLKNNGKKCSRANFYPVL